MKLIRRIYIYLVTFISFEVTAWAIIGLVRSIFDTSVGGNASDLAQALSMIVVGGIVFWIHWRMAQNDAAKDVKERLSTIRAIFFYVTWASLVGPVVQNFLAIVYRSLSSIFNIPINTYDFAANQNNAENIIAILVNILLASYVYKLIQDHWKENPEVEVYKTVRRVSRYAWKIYGLGMLLAGIEQIFSYIFGSFDSVGSGATRALVWGLSFLIVGLPLWLFVWQIISKSLKESGERESLLRQVILYVLSLIGAVVSLLTVGILISETLESIFVSKLGFSNFISRIGEPLSILIPAIIVWIYFYAILKQDRAADPHITRRSGMRRLYQYILSFLGIVTTLAGLAMMVVFLADVIAGGDRLVGSGWKNQWINIFTFLVIGIPVWLKNWLPMNAEAAEESEAGDHARRSVNRKGYLYILLFVGVIGIMFIAGSLLYLIISTLLGDPPDDILHFLIQVLGALIILSIITLYHWRQLRADNTISSKSLTAQHAEFSVGILESGDGQFSEALLAEFTEEVPGMPVTVYSTGKPLGENAKNSDAIVLLASLLANPSATTSAFLTNFSGARVVIPEEVEKWEWVGISSGKDEKWHKKAVQTIEKMAEKQTFSLQFKSPWIYLLIGLFGLPFLCSLFSILAEFAF